MAARGWGRGPMGLRTAYLGKDEKQAAVAQWIVQQATGGREEVARPTSMAHGPACTAIQVGRGRTQPGRARTSQDEPGIQGAWPIS